MPERGKIPNVYRLKIKSRNIGLKHDNRTSRIEHINEFAVGRLCQFVMSALSLCHNTDRC